MSKESIGLLNEQGVSIPLTGVEVRGSITGHSARVKIHQSFSNIESKALEVVYKFPLPAGSSICGFKATIGEKIIQGEIEEGQRAFELFDGALSRGDGAFLLDEERPNIFTLSLGNISPGVSVTVEIDYVTLLDAHNSEARFFLPTTISPRYLPPDIKDRNGIPVDEYVNPPLALDASYGLKILLDIQGRDNIQSLESPSHPVSTSFLDNSIRVELTSDNIAMDRDFILNIKYRKSFETAGYLYRKDEDCYIQVDFSPKPPSKSPSNNSPNQEIIFVLDCSGSMGGSSIIEAKRALGILLKALEMGTRFNIYRFGSTFSSLFNSSLPYGAKTLDTALKYLSNIDADLGGTRILAPLQAIQRSLHEETISSVLLLTDGQVGNEEQIIDLVRAGSGGMRMFTVGIGNGPNEYFIKQLARISGGASELVAPNERIEPRVLRLFSQMSLAGNIQDFEVDWGTRVTAADVPRVVYSGETISVLAKLEDNQALPEKVILSGMVNRSRQEWVASITQLDADNSSLPCLWARARIHELEESETATIGSKQYHRKEGKVKQAIIEVSKEYGIISRETSFVAIEKRMDTDKTTGEVVLRKVPVMLTHGWGALREGRMMSPLRRIDLVQFRGAVREGRMMRPLRRSNLVQHRGGAVDRQVGMHGFRLDVETHIIAAAMTGVQNLVKCIRGIGIDIDDMILGPLASSEAILTEDEKQVGVILADIGGGITDIAVFKDSSSWHTAILPVAGYQLTRDVAIGLGLPFDVAEEIKKRYSSVMPVYEAQSKTTSTISADGHDVSYQDLCDIVRTRVEEIMRLILLELPRSGYESMVPAGLVLTGGSAKLSGIEVLGRDVLRLPVRVGVPMGMSGITDVLRDPAHTTSVGLLLWAGKHEGRRIWKTQGPFRRFVSRIKEKRATLTSIDVGTTKVCTMISEVDEGGGIRVVGVGVTPSKGLHKGLVVNINEAREQIRESVRIAEQSSGYKVESAYIGVTGQLSV